MLLLTAIVFLPLTLALAVVGGLEVRDDSPCQDVHLFLARGAGEDYPGRVGAINDAVCSGLSSCGYEDILFTSIDGSVYCSSVAEGATNGISQITAYHERCPDAKLVLAGYSLGAHVVGDILGGGGGDFYNCIEPGNSGLNPGTGPGSQIAAALLFGDVRHTSNEVYNVGTGSGDEGEYPRSGSELADLNAFSSKLQSYCLSTDPICALGDDGESHTTYMQVYASTAGAWVVKMLSQPISASSSSSPPPPPSTSSSPPPPPTTSSTPPPPPTTSSSSSAAPTSTTPTTTTSSVQSTTSSSSTQDTSSSSSASSSSEVIKDSNTSTSTSSPTLSTISASPSPATQTSSSPSSSSTNSARPTGYSLSLVSLVVVGALTFQ